MGMFSKAGGFFSGPPAVRRLDQQAATMLEQALGQYGQVTHIVDPKRDIAFSSGGPPVWSIGFVTVPGPRPYTLVVTYGLSYAISPEAERADVEYELSIAIPQGEPFTPWADAFLRAQAQRILAQKIDIKVGTCMSFAGAPITRVAFPPDQAAAMPNTNLVGMLVAKDPAIPTVRTQSGDVEIRRLVGIDQFEIDRAVTWDPAAFLELVRGIDPQLVSALQRASYMPQLASAIEPRAQRDGSAVEGVLLDLAWQQGPQSVRVMLPQGPAVQRVVNALRGRIGFNRKLIAFSTIAQPITFSPGPPGMDVTPNGLELVGDLQTPPISTVAEALAAGAQYVDLSLQPVPPARVRSRFFEKIAATIRNNELDQVRMTKELGKLVDEARSVAAMESQVAPIERDADRAAASAIVRTLRFARATDQSTIEPLIQLLTPK